MLQMKPRVRVLMAGLLTLGMLSSVAVSSLVVVPALAWAIIRSARRAGARSVLAISLCVGGVGAMLSMTPVGVAFAARASAGWDQSSNSMRLIRPFEELLPQAMAESPLVGLGPGSAHRASLVGYSGWQSEIATPTLAKVGFEYGIVGLAILAAFCLRFLVRVALPPPLIVAALLMLLIPTDGLASGLIAPFAVILSQGLRGRAERIS